MVLGEETGPRPEERPEPPVEGEAEEAEAEELLGLLATF
jgi:hypothetical protein